jgi:hypothetical protein
MAECFATITTFCRWVVTALFHVDRRDCCTAQTSRHRLQPLGNEHVRHADPFTSLSVGFLAHLVLAAVTESASERHADSGHKGRIRPGRPHPPWQKGRQPPMKIFHWSIDLKR